MRRHRLRPLLLLAGCGQNPFLTPLTVTASPDSTSVTARTRASPRDRQQWQHPVPTLGVASITTSGPERTGDPNRAIITFPGALDKPVTRLHATPMNELQRRLSNAFELPVLRDQDTVVLGGHSVTVTISRQGQVRAEVRWGGEVRAHARIEGEGTCRQLIGVQLSPHAQQQDLAELTHALEPALFASELDTLLARLLIPPQAGGQTPWGEAVVVEEVEPDVWLVRARDHGGYWLGLDALARLPAPARTTDGWYEEDLAAMVPAVFLGWADRTPQGEETRRLVRQQRLDLQAYL